MPNFGIFSYFLGGLFNSIGTGIAARYNLQAVQETNEANKEMTRETNLINAAIADATNQTNKELVDKTNQANKDLAYKNNLFSQKQANIAYQRSTPENQIAELVKSGMSYQQAKQIVAGSGQAASYSPVSPQPISFQAPQYQPYTQNAAHFDPAMLDMGAISQASTNLGGGIGSFADDLVRQDGGTFGQMIAAPAVQAISENMASIDENDLTSVKALSNWLNSERSKVLSDEQRQKVGACLKSFVGSRAMLQQLKSYTSSFSDSQHYKSLVQQVKQAELQTQILDLQRQLSEGQLDLQSLEIEFNELRNEKQILLQPFEVQTTIQNLLNSFYQASANTELWSSEKFRKRWISNQLSDEEVRSLVIVGNRIDAKMRNMTLTAANDYLKNHKVTFGIYELFKRAGVTDNEIGQIVATVTAGSKGNIDPVGWIENILGVTADELDPNEQGGVSKWNYTKDAEIKIKRAERTGDYSQIPGITRHAKHDHSRKE